MINQRVMVTAIIKNKKKYLLLRRGKKARLWKYRWQFPEGGIEFGESPEKALRRELKEELNLKVRNPKFLNFYSSTLRFFGKSLYHVLRLLYECEVRGKIRLGEEHDKHKWFTKKEMKKLKLMKGLELEELKDIT